jgi:aryl-alcohol dehydrogenase-like predicted oxidoreductase
LSRKHIIEGAKRSLKRL